MGVKIITRNKRAGYDYFLQEKIEAGLALQGTEVKSLRQGKAVLTDAFVMINEGEAWIHNLRIPPYEFGTYDNHDEARVRKLLLNKKEIAKLQKGLQAEGLTIVPTALYFKKSLVKLEIALAKGKKLHDKRESIAKRDIERKIQQGKYD